MQHVTLVNQMSSTRGNVNICLSLLLMNSARRQLFITLRISYNIYLTQLQWIGFNAKNNAIYYCARCNLQLQRESAPVSMDYSFVNCTCSPLTVSLIQGPTDKLLTLIIIQNTDRVSCKSELIYRGAAVYYVQTA